MERHIVSTQWKLAGAAVVAAFLMAASGGTTAQAQQTRIIIGTAGVTGVYYPTGGTICRLVNAGSEEHGIRCAVESTAGSVYNARNIRTGGLDFGVVQSNVQADAWHGVRAFENDTPYADLRAVFSVHADVMHVMVRADAGIDSVADMKGKRVNIGNPGSGTRMVANALMQAAGVMPGDFALTAELESVKQSAALCAGRLDAVIWSAGLPNASSMEATSSCDIKILDLTNAVIDKVLASNSAFAAATIPGGTYPGNADDIASWGPRATFLTDAGTANEVVYTLVKAVFENFDDFKNSHPAFSQLTEAEMLEAGLTAPLHPGAVKYYKERGWM